MLLKLTHDNHKNSNAIGEKNALDNLLNDLNEIDSQKLIKDFVIVYKGHLFRFHIFQNNCRVELVLILFLNLLFKTLFSRGSFLVVSIPYHSF